MKRFGVVITLGLAAYIMLPTSGLSAPLADVAGGVAKRTAHCANCDGLLLRLSEHALPSIQANIHATRFCRAGAGFRPACTTARPRP